jgi:hypothetical protein
MFTSPIEFLKPTILTIESWEYRVTRGLHGKWAIITEMQI